MDASEYARFILDDSAFQVEKVFDGIPEELADTKVNEHSMSPRECLIHLLDCVQAYFAVRAGKDYAWGSSAPADPSLAGMLAQYRAERAEIKRDLDQSNGDDKALKTLYHYVAGHETYHVGQMATFRLTHTPGWDPYSIYPQA